MHLQSHNRAIILASSSPYRKILLERLNLNFTVLSHSIDESPMQDESPAMLVSRLAKEKAQGSSVAHPHALVIGSDQLAVFEGRIIGKPGSVHKAVEQLQQFSGNFVRFHTAVAVKCSESGYFSNATIDTDVYFRELGDAEIKRYVAMDNPIDCAGGFKSEAGGSALLTRMVSDDPSAIIGLPLIRLSAMLREAGIHIP
jgi:septum formation protein